MHNPLLVRRSFYQSSESETNRRVLRSQLIEEHPLEILNHAYRHGYHDLADLVAVETIDKPLEGIARCLTHPGLLQKWVSILYFTHHNLTLNLENFLSFYTTSVGEMLPHKALSRSMNTTILRIAVCGPWSRPIISQPWWGILGVRIMSSIMDSSPVP